ncbi:hypothetical protein ABIA96_003800 [Bradyrhizobium sp. LB11.1]
MTRKLRQRIEKLEGGRGQGTPNVVVAICPIPETDLPLRLETVEQWLAAGLAHIAFRGHVVLYDGGRRHPLSVEEWQARHCSTDGLLH